MERTLSARRQQQQVEDLEKLLRHDLRPYKSLEVLDPRLRETINTQEFFQDLESLEPSLSQLPLRASEFLGFKVPKHQNP